ncbi:hypothetical protein KY360_04770 [Candidatus Woesearchaeota archaeon]|nr:hypothetical protein [Candidatus Woesearchaeota archaeon]
MTAIEVLALIFGLVVLEKMIVGVLWPKVCLKHARRFLKHKTFPVILYLVLAVIIGIYVFNSMSIVQVAAVMLLSWILLALCLVPYSETALKLGQVMLGKDMVKKDWLALAIWAGLAIWAILAVLL